jgi:hypothetical protein
MRYASQPETIGNHIPREVRSTAVSAFVYCPGYDSAQWQLNLTNGPGEELCDICNFWSEKEL